MRTHTVADSPIGDLTLVAEGAAGRTPPAGTTTSPPASPLTSRARHDQRAVRPCKAVPKALAAGGGPMHR